MSDFKALAQAYIDQGITVVPTKKKAPFLKNYYNLSHSEIMSADWSGVDGINILTGPRSGVAVLDIDILKSKEPEKYREVYGSLPKIYCGRIGNKDKAPAILFQYNGEKSRKWPHISVEFFGEKGNVVLPPSIHPNGYAYEWHGIPLDQCEVDDLPSVSEELFNVLDDLNEKYKPKKKNGKKNHELIPEAGRCNHGSHNVLSDYAVALRRAGYSMNTVARRLDAKDKEINANADFTYFECPKRKDFTGLTRQEAIEKFVGAVFQNNAKGSRPADESEFNQFRDFLDANLNDPRLCKISGSFVEKHRGQWKPVINRIKSLQSYAVEQELPHTKVEMHLTRYIENADPQLLVDIPEWDGRDWIREIVSYITFKNEAEKPVFEQYFKYWVSRVFARLENPINQNIFLLLRGDQGIGKDRLIYNLFHKFDPYYANFSVQPNKEVDTWHQVASHLILHLQEFDQTSKLGVPFLKELITTNRKEYRLPYDRAPESRRMFGSFISTANVDNLFRDTTGNRRFAVFDLEYIDWSYPKDFGLQILAQGQALYNGKFEIDKNYLDYMKAKIEELTPDDLSESVIEMWQDRMSMLRQRDGMMKELYKTHEVDGILSDIARSVGWSVRGIQSLLKRKGFSGKVNGNKRYSQNPSKLFKNQAIKTEK